VNSLPPRIGVFHPVNVLQIKRKPCIFVPAAATTVIAKINAGKYFPLMEKDEMACPHAESTWH